MNQLELQSYRNKIASLCISFHTKQNVVYFNTHNSVQHEMLKARLCFELQKTGVRYITEAPLNGRKGEGKADILVLDTAEVIEILVSEKVNEVEHKTMKYPEELTILAVSNWEDYFNGSYTTIRSGRV